jgi:hypothetical protein
MLARYSVAISIAVGVPSSIASAQYYPPPLAYPYHAPPAIYHYYVPPVVYRYHYAPLVSYYPPYVFYHSRDPVRRFWNRLQRSRY